ncbi:MAG: hypothetical protein HYX37_02605 [Rhizobiales bacterium]|nr:hypothetical protein [Hyphomicrobiales bacterium]
MMPDDTRRWIEAASWARYRRDVRDATNEANALPMGERPDWLNARKFEAETRHLARMQDAERQWPEALADAERAFCQRLAAEIESAL